MLNLNISEARVTRKGSAFYVLNGEAVDCAWDGNIGAGAGIASDNDVIAVDGVLPITGS